MTAAGEKILPAAQAGARAPEDPAHLDLWLGAGPDGRVRILRRHVAWPWSLPRGFRLQGPDGPLSLLPQAAAAALLPGDDWRHRIRLDAGRVHLLTAGATAVHAGGSAAARTGWHFTLAPGAQLAQMPDPVVLFPGARLVQQVRAEVAEGAAFLFMDGICRRDPGAAAAGGLWSNELQIRRPGGALLLDERQTADEALLADLARLPGRATAFGTLIAVAPAGICAAIAHHLPPALWEGAGLWGAMAALRGNQGCVLRLAAPSGGALSAAFARIRAALAPVI